MNPSQEARTPPRYVPTLTEVVKVPEGVLPRSEAVLLSDLAPLDAVPLQALPLQEVSLQEDRQREVPQHEVQVLQEAWPEPMSSPPNAAPALLDDWAEQITQRVLERLEQRLCFLLEEQSAEMARGLAQAVSLRLRSELPELVQQAVHAWPAPSDTQPASGQ